MKHKLFKILIGFTVITLMLNTLLITSPQKVLAASFVVNSNGDQSDAAPGDGICLSANGTCTLRAAIEEANIHPGGDLISIPAMIIIINEPLRVTQDVVIQGAGQDLTIIDGNHATQVFYFGARTGSHSISDLTIRNGDATLKNANLPGRQANNKDGGGIFNEATLTVTNVTITGNQANHGGGIYNEFAFPPDGGGDLNIPLLVLNYVTISNNTSNAVDVNQGGGGLHNGSCFQGDHVTILSNLAANQGGGFFNDSNCGNYANSKVPGPDVTLKNFVISGNRSKFGGGVNHDLGMGPVTLSDGVISGNASVCCYTDPKTGTIYQTGGGGIYNQGGTFRLINVVVANNAATSPAGYGGGIVNVWGDMTLQNVTIYGNQTAYGAGIYNGGEEVPSLIPPGWTTPHNKLVGINLTVSSNLGISDPVNQATGGGIYNTDNGKITLVNATVASNISRFAGGINNKPDATKNVVFMVNSILAYNQSILERFDPNTSFTPECWGTIQSTGFNILLDPTNCNFLSVSSDKISTDPLLLPLLSNGGSVLTHGLRLNSPAIDAGNTDPSICPLTDARGVPRPQIGPFGRIPACDIGAYEYKPFYIFIPIVHN